ncbi:hypothetical protein L484_018024 [Morus notabilis]|uniref:Uncharacterized protein n=1 Tax=Morus notabilis TaxID=981085 RepID=W9RRP7_9ROSA|nr:hypothetical protein L484_018024 [Morus notabilis]
MIKMMISCRTSAAIFVLIIVEITFCSSLCLCHEQNILQRDHQRSLLLSRKLLFSSTMASVSVSPNNDKLRTSSAMKEPKKAVETSLRKAPASGPNPTQNK